MSHYSLLDELMASDSQSLDACQRAYTIEGMRQALAAIERSASPTDRDWRVLSDAVNLMETLLEMGEIEDTQGLLKDAVAAMAGAAHRKVSGGQIRFDGAGVQAMRGLIDDFEMVIEALPARTMIRCHRRTEQRLRAIYRGKKRGHDVVIVSI